MWLHLWIETVKALLRLWAVHQIMHQYEKIKNFHSNTFVIDYSIVRSKCFAPSSNECSGTPWFSCDIDRTMIPFTLVCDHKEDCLGGEDEQLCYFPPCSGVKFFRCKTGQVRVEDHNSPAADYTDVFRYINKANYVGLIRGNMFDLN